MNPTAQAAVLTGLFLVLGAVVSRLLTASDRRREIQKDERARTDEQARVSEQARINEQTRTDESDKAIRHEYDIIIQRLQAEVASHIEEKKQWQVREAVLTTGLEKRTDDIEKWRGLHDKLAVIVQRKDVIIFLLHRDRKEVLNAMQTLKDYLHSDEHAKQDSLQVVDMVITKLLMDIDMPVVTNP